MSGPVEAGASVDRKVQFTPGEQWLERRGYRVLVTTGMFGCHIEVWAPSGKVVLSRAAGRARAYAEAVEFIDREGEQ